MKARGKREAQRNASPLVTTKIIETEHWKCEISASIIPLFQSLNAVCGVTRGDAPHVVRRLPLAFIFRAFGACSRLSYTRRGLAAFIFRAFGAGTWLSYPAPLALAGFHIRRLWRWQLANFCAEPHHVIKENAVSYTAPHGSISTPSA